MQNENWRKDLLFTKLSLMKLSYEELEAKFVANHKFLVKSQGDLERSRESQRQTQKILDWTLRILQETQENLKER